MKTGLTSVTFERLSLENFILRTCDFEGTF